MIGIDFDNTVIDYDRVFVDLAREQNLIPDDFVGGKKAVRDWVRFRAQGEERWQELQLLAYGTKIGGACLMEGFADFVTLARQKKSRLAIVSHKSLNLQEAALNWMRGKKFFKELGFHAEDIHFGQTREEKIGVIQRLGCTHFIDDLVETFLENTFPAGVEKLLLDRHGEYEVPKLVRSFTNWAGLSRYLFP